MSNILNTIASKAGAPDGSWVDAVVANIQSNALKIEQPEFRDAVIGATLALLAHKEDIASLGIYGLTLFMQRLASGDHQGAYITFIQTQATFQDLIDGQNADADAIIADKQRRDEMLSKAISVATDIAIAGARALLPFLLALLI